jgi:N-acetylglutamate synthase-like GNAT family acetyltransferase
MKLHDILELDYAYLDTFTTRTVTKWGSFFCNESQPTYFDANHAHIDRAYENPQKMIDEVVEFYQSRNLRPRIYLYDLAAQQNLLARLKANHFGYEELISPVQLWDHKLVEKEDDEGVTIEVVTEENYSETLAIECSIKEFGGKSVREKAFEHEFRHPRFEHFLLRYHGKPCATACIFSSGNQARLESVATLEAYRGRGLIGELIRFIQKEAAKKDIENLWVFPINERVEKVYQKYGFQTVEKLRMGHAFLGGRSIKEIREEE